MVNLSAISSNIKYDVAILCYVRNNFIIKLLNFKIDY